MAWHGPALPLQKYDFFCTRQNITPCFAEKLLPATSSA
jgi:hypothetical protein